jgi:hypothetical protein
MEGDILNGLDSLRTLATSSDREVRMWAALALPLASEVEAAAVVLIEELQDRSTRVRETALASLTRIAAVVMEPLDLSAEESLLRYVGRVLQPGDRRGLAVARLLAPTRFAAVLREHLERARRLEQLPRSLVDHSAMWAIARNDGDLLAGVFPALDHYSASTVAEEFDARAVLAGAAVILDEPRAARLLLNAAAEGLGRSSPSPVHAAILLFLTNQLGLGAANPKNLPDLRDLVSPRPAIALEWLERALERLAQAGVEVRGLRKLAVDGRWVMVQRALLEDIDDLIDAAGEGVRLAAALMEGLEERRLAGAIPAAMRPWASVLAAASRLRILRARELAQTRPVAAPLLTPNADLELLLDHLEGGGRDLQERFGLARRALRISGATGERPRDARALELLRQRAEFWHAAGQEPLSQIGLYLLAASGDARALGELRSGALEEAAGPALINSASQALATAPRLFSEMLDELLAGPEEWKIVRGLQFVRHLPARSGWAERLDREWESWARLDLDSLTHIAGRTPDPLMLQRLAGEAQAGATEITFRALLLAAVQAAPAEELERLRAILSHSLLLTADAPAVDCRCNACGRIFEYAVDCAVIDRALFQESGGTQGFLPGPRLECRRCGAVDEMIPLPVSARGVIWNAEEIEWRQVDLRSNGGPPPLTVRAFLDDFTGADGQSTRAGRLAVLGRGDDALAEIDLDPTQNRDLLSVLLLLEMGRTELAAEALEKARAALTGSDSEQRREELQAALDVVSRVVAEQSPQSQVEREEELPWERQDPVKKRAQPRRNDPCPCGSGRKYKQCCLRRASR